MSVLRLNLLSNEQAVGGPAFAACRSQGPQSHWSAFEPLLGTSVLNNSSAGVSGLVVVSEKRCKSNRSSRDRLSYLNLFWKESKIGMRWVFILLIIIYSSSILLTISSSLLENKFSYLSFRYRSSNHFTYRFTYR